MKSFVLLTFFAVACLAKRGPPPEFKEFAEACAKENNIKAPEGPPPAGPPKEPPSHDQKCFMKCIQTKAGMFSDKGDLNVDKMKEKMSLSDADAEKLKKCNDDNKQDDICEKVHAKMMCVWKEVKPKRPPPSN